VNAAAVRRIAETFPDLPLQVGGGIRSLETMDAYLAAGVRWCIIGTKAVREPHFVSELCLAFPGHVIVGLDARDGKVAVEGWSKLSRHDVVDIAQHFERDGVEAIVYTDISRDGMLSGVNVEATRRLAAAINIPVIASGGITNLDDVRALCGAGEPNIVGAITGRAIYEGTLDFAAGQRLMDELTGGSAA
jgi:phosphoribosylformimino-5-aminoimidazole carboxamide ribotide isomerase